jgi:hypothetical protein
MLVLYVVWFVSADAVREVLSLSSLTDMGPRAGLCISLFIPKKKKKAIVMQY